MQGESNSITNQKLMLKKYATDNGFKNDEEEFKKMLVNKIDSMTRESEKDDEKKLATSKDRINKLNSIIPNLYEDKINGVITKERFDPLKNDFQTQNDWVKLYDQTTNQK